MRDPWTAARPTVSSGISMPGNANGVHREMLLIDRPDFEGIQSPPLLCHGWGRRSDRVQTTLRFRAALLGAVAASVLEFNLRESNRREVGAGEPPPPRMWSFSGCCLTRCLVTLAGPFSNKSVGLGPLIPTSRYELDSPWRGHSTTG